MTTTHLRPVPAVDTPTREPSLRRPRDVARLSAHARATRAALAEWALRTGVCCDFDAVTVVLACADACGAPTTFTEEDVWRLWWIELSEWCVQRSVAQPAGLATAMRVLFDHLAATDGFGAGSDPVEELLDAMEGAGAVWSKDRMPSGTA